MRLINLKPVALAGALLNSGCILGTSGTSGKSSGETGGAGGASVANSSSTMTTTSSTGGGGGMGGNPATTSTTSSSSISSSNTTSTANTTTTTSTTSTGMGGNGGSGGEGGSGGAAAIRILISPNGITLPPKLNTLLSWTSQNIVPVTARSHYDLAPLQGSPNELVGQKCYRPIGGMLADSSYAWTAQTCSDLNAVMCTDFPDSYLFNTDHSLQLWARFDDATFATISDSSGNNNAGATTGTPQKGGGVTYDPVFNANTDTAPYFNGVNQYTTFSSLSNFGTEDFTWIISTLISFNPLIQTFMSQIDYSANAGAGNGISLFQDDQGILTFYGVGCNLLSGGDLTAPDWHTAGVRRINGVVTLFYDGQPTDSGACATDIMNGAFLTVGCNSPNQPGGCFELTEGRLDDVVVLDTGLSDEGMLLYHLALRAIRGKEDLTPLVCP